MALRIGIEHEAFIDWAATLPCPVLTLDGARPIAELLADALAFLSRIKGGN